MTSEKICRDDAHMRARIDYYAEIVGDFLIRYGDPDNGPCLATVRLVEGCQFDINDVADALRNQFPLISKIEVRDEEFLHEMHISIDRTEMQSEWDNHQGEFEKRVVGTLMTLSRKNKFL